MITDWKTFVYYALIVTPKLQPIVEEMLRKTWKENKNAPLAKTSPRINLVFAICVQQ